MKKISMSIAYLICFVAFVLYLLFMMLVYKSIVKTVCFEFHFSVNKIWTKCVGLRYHKKSLDNIMILCIIIVSVFVDAYRIKFYASSNSDIIFLQGEEDEIT